MFWNASVMNRMITGLSNGQFVRPSRQIAKLLGNGGFGYQRVNAGVKGLQVMRKPHKSSLGLMLGAAGTVVTYNGLRSMNCSSTILNEAVAVTGNSITDQLNTNISVSRKPKKHLGGVLNYQELCLGSITGLFLGVIAGKLSSVIVFLTLSSYLLAQFLQSRGIITIPWRKLVHVGSNTIDARQLIFEQPNFKISFVLTFLIAAYNI